MSQQKKLMDIVRRANARELGVYRKAGGFDGEPDYPVSNVQLRVQPTAQ